MYEEEEQFNFETDSSGVIGGGVGQVEDAPAQSKNCCRIMPHPIAVFFHLAFKIAALVFFLIFPIFSPYIAVFIVTVLLLAADFWTVKNVTGRLLVGLRWWNEIKEDGSNEWIFESLEGERQVHKLESTIFWSVLFAAPALWILLCVGELITLSLSNLIIAIIAAAFSSSNAIGYVKCARSARKQVTKMATDWATQQAVQHITDRIVSGNNAADGDIEAPKKTPSSLYEEI
jgi:golgi apparatus membrane protein TVP23